jgi:hypothetical protein
MGWPTYPPVEYRVYIMVYENLEASGSYICSLYRKRLSEIVDIVMSVYQDPNRPKK